MAEASQLSEEELEVIESLWNGERLGFERHAIDGLQLVKASRGAVEFSLVPTEHHLNFHGTLHGGCIATMVDVVGSAAIFTMGAARHVSIDLNVTYIGSCNPGEEVRIIGRCPRVGGRIGFSDVEFWRKRRAEEADTAVRPNDADEILVASGRHTKYIMREKPPRSKL